MNVKSLAILLALSLNVSFAMAAPVQWVNWTSATPGSSGSAVGSMSFGATSVGVNLSGNFNNFVNGSAYYASYPATYANLSPSDLLQEWTTGTVNLTFSQPVADLYLALVSVGSAGAPVTYGFDRPFTVVSSGPNFWGYTGYSTSGNSFTGREYNGILKFAGTHSSLSFNIDRPENWHGFNAGAVAAVVPEPGTYALLLTGLGLAGFAARRRRHQGGLSA